MTLKEIFRSITRRPSDEGDVLVREDRELSDAYLQNLQGKIDSNLKQGTTFTSVSRASW